MSQDVKCCTIGNATLYHADWNDVNLPPFDAIVSDPPYGINLSIGRNKSNIISQNTGKIIGDDVEFDPGKILTLAGTSKLTNVDYVSRRPVALFGANYYSYKLPPGRWLTWDKACGQGPNTNFCDSELIWVNRKIARSVFHFMWIGMIRSGQDSSELEKRYHVSQKPVELLIWLINQMRIGIGKTVLDPYMGSGSTGVACLQTGRKFIGIEIDEKHYNSACERLRNTQNKIDAGFKFLTEDVQSESEFI